MTELLTAAQMRAIEKAAIESGEVTGLELMERAGRGVVEAIFEEWPELAKTSHRAVVLCGPGNNGGDGFVVARLLKQWGWEVEVFLYGDPEKLPPDARVNYERWCGMGEVEDLARADPPPHYGCDLVVDALFGTGLVRPLQGAAQDQADQSTHRYGFFRTAKIVSVDVPSGLCADSGRRLDDDGFVVMASMTVAFHSPKVGHFLGIGPDVSGRLRTVDIGLSSSKSVDSVSLLEAVDAPAKDDAYSHKYTHGHALILSGGPGKGGAARLAARGALRIGAGLVTVGCPPSALQENAARLDAVMLKPVHDADALAHILEDPRINALALGPGLGTGEREEALIGRTLGANRPTVLDADALTILAWDRALFAALHENCVLTPHAGEFARLFPDIAEKLAAPVTKGPAYSKVDATREAAQRAGCTVLFKGPDTVIADPEGRAAIDSAHYDRAAPWLATAGSGDVLTGMIAGLLARGFAPKQAAETAAWLHVECALSFGPGLIAEDLPEELPKVFRKLGL